MCNYYPPHAFCLTANHLWGERERVVWSICVAWAVKYPFTRCVFREENYSLEAEKYIQKQKMYNRNINEYI